MRNAYLQQKSDLEYYKKGKKPPVKKDPMTPSAKDPFNASNFDFTLDGSMRMSIGADFAQTSPFMADTTSTEAQCDIMDDILKKKLSDMQTKIDDLEKKLQSA